ncbi:MAG: ABC transporter ATP-binding protein [Thermoguttaceae bacterium]
MRMAACTRELTKEYVLDGETVRALRGVSLDIPEGDWVAIMGASGSGKSTMLNLLACLDRPTAGSIMLGDDDVSKLNDDQLSEIRASRIGIVFQSYNLIPQLTVLENIEVPLYYQGVYNSKARKRCVELAAMVGLADRLKHRPTQLSGGQQQRVAIARSLVNDPYFILADEPTGNLDSATTEEILQLLEQLNRDGKTIIMVTHESDVGDRTKRVVVLRDGLVISDRPTDGHCRSEAEPKTQSPPPADPAALGAPTTTTAPTS